MKTGRKLTASSLFTILGVICFSTIVIAAGTILSNTLSIGPEDVADYAIDIASGTGAGNDWSDASDHYKGATYSETFTCTPNGYSNTYHLEIAFTISSVNQAVGGWAMTATCEGSAVTMTWDTTNSVWYSAAVTPSAVDDWVITFTPNSSGTAFYLEIEAYSGAHV